MPDLGPELVEVDVHALDVLALLRHLAEVLSQLQLRLQNLYSVRQGIIYMYIVSTVMISTTFLRQHVRDTAIW